jgi:hypothetical protein
MQHFSSRDISDYGHRFVLQYFKGKVLYICQTAPGLTKSLLLSLGKIDEKAHLENTFDWLIEL